MTSSWLPIRYRDFHDVPRAIIVELEGATYLLDCLFDHDLDDYEPTYTVYRVPTEVATRLEEMSWTDLGHRSTQLGTVEVEDVVFDSTRRAAIDAGVMDRFRDAGEGGARRGD